MLALDQPSKDNDVVTLQIYRQILWLVRNGNIHFFRIGGHELVEQTVKVCVSFLCYRYDFKNSTTQGLHWRHLLVVILLIRLLILKIGWRLIQSQIKSQAEITVTEMMPIISAVEIETLARSCFPPHLSLEHSCTDLGDDHASHTYIYFAVHFPRSNLSQRVWKIGVLILEGGASVHIVHYRLLFAFCDVESLTFSIQ